MSPEKAKSENLILSWLKKVFNLEQYTGITIEHIEQQVREHGSGSHTRADTWDTIGTSVGESEPKPWLNSQETKPSRISPQDLELQRLQALLDTTQTSGARNAILKRITVIRQRSGSSR